MSDTMHDSVCGMPVHAGQDYRSFILATNYGSVRKSAGSSSAPTQRAT